MDDLHLLQGVSQADLLRQIPNEALPYVEDIDRAATAIIEYVNSGDRIRNHMKSQQEQSERTNELTSAGWEQLKLKFKTLVCTDASEFSDLRTSLRTAGTTTAILLIAQVSSALGECLGMATGSIVSLVALLLWAVARTGVSAFCATVL